MTVNVQGILLDLRAAKISVKIVWLLITHTASIEPSTRLGNNAT